MKTFYWLAGIIGALLAGFVIYLAFFKKNKPTISVSAFIAKAPGSKEGDKTTAAPVEAFKNMKTTTVGTSPVLDLPVISN